MKDKTNNIVEKATMLFMQNGLHPVSMYNIASYSGISKKNQDGLKYFFTLMTGYYYENLFHYP